MILVDSSAWIDFFNQRDTAAARTLDPLLDQGERTLAIGDLVLMQVLQGFRSDRDFKAAKRLLLLLESTALAVNGWLSAPPITTGCCAKKGVTVVSSIDVLIATFCVEQGFDLLHNDNDFIAIQRHLPLKTLQSV